MKSPAFQFYPSDFLSDVNVVLMTNQELGCYIKLISFCWLQGSIPNDVRKISKLCNEDGSAMAQLWQAIKNCFKEAPDDCSKLIHPRLEAERHKQIMFKDERSKSGKRGAKARWNIGIIKNNSDGSAMAQPIAEPMAKNGSSSSSSSISSTTEEKQKEKITSLVAKTEIEDENGTDEKGQPNCPHTKIIALYHKILPELQRVKAWTPKRANQLRLRWAEKPERQNLGYWEKYFNYVRESKYLMGKVNDWSANLEFLTRLSGFTNTIEGKYHQERKQP